MRFCPASPVVPETTLMHSTPPDSLDRDPSWFPAQFDPASDAIGFRRMTVDAIAAASFLARRAVTLDDAILRAPRRELEIDACAPQAAFLFHTAFCGSTLLARTLQDPPRIVSLREPQILLDIAHAAGQAAPGAMDEALRTALGLLARPWTDDGRCLIKPTNQANSLLPAILRLSGGRAILLYSSLPEFILSCCKKLPAAETFVLWMARHFLRGSRLQDALGVRWDQPFHFVEACVLAWHAQIELFADALVADAADRLRSLDFATLLADPPAAVPASARWLGLGADDDFWKARAAVEFSRNAKHVERSYDAARRAEEREALLQRYRGLVEAALAWSRGAIEPVARKPANWKPLLPDRA